MPTEMGTATEHPVEPDTPTTLIPTPPLADVMAESISRLEELRAADARRTGMYRRLQNDRAFGTPLPPTHPPTHGGLATASTTGPGPGQPPSRWRDDPPPPRRRNPRGCAVIIRDQTITPSADGPFGPVGRARYFAFNATACNAWERDYNGSPTGTYRRAASEHWRRAFAAIGALPGYELHPSGEVVETRGAL